MPTRQMTMWNVMRENLPLSERVSIERIYSTVQEHLQLEPDDFEPSATGTKDLRWKRNVRNILQHRKKTGEIVWLGEGIYMFPPSGNTANLNSSVPVKAGITREQFEKLLQIQQEVGDQGEELVVRYEKERLRQSGKENLAEQVMRVSLLDSGAGYDIRSFESDGSDRFIEVKATVGVGRMFEWTANEFGVAQKLGNRYWIYRVHEIRDKPQVEKIQNPANGLGTMLTIEPSAYLVRLLKTSQQ